MEYVTPEDFETAANNGIAHRNVHDRVYNYGWKIERAITEPVRKLGKRKKWIQIAEKNGIRAGTFYTRIATLGWDLETAATKPPAKVGNYAEEATHES